MTFYFAYSVLVILADIKAVKDVHVKLTFYAVVIFLTAESPTGCWCSHKLTEFKGNIIFYSHDYETVNTVANRIIELREDGILDYSGTYEEFIQYKKEKGLI